jgi:5,6,7,8-tetrahydromethanopterin hydro-lyase
MAITLATGEALVGEGDEVAHIDLLLGSKTGPVGQAFANALVSESNGHTNLLAVVTANLPDLALIVGVFIHWDAADDKKIYDYNYEATKLAIARAFNGEPSIDKVLADTPAARHPFAGGTED